MSAPGREVVGCRIKVWREKDDCWVEGSVASYSSRRGHLVKYDEADGEGSSSVYTELGVFGGVGGARRATRPPAKRYQNAAHVGQRRRTARRCRFERDFQLSRL